MQGVVSSQSEAPVVVEGDCRGRPDLTGVSVHLHEGASDGQAAGAGDDYGACGAVQEKHARNHGAASGVGVCGGEGKVASA